MFRLLYKLDILPQWEFLMGLKKFWIWPISLLNLFYYFSLSEQFGDGAHIFKDQTMDGIHRGNYFILFLFQNNLETEHKFSRTRLWMEYIGEEQTRPVPFNLIPTVPCIKQFFASAKSYFERTIQRRVKLYLRIHYTNSQHFLSLT